jgi:large subunit ribosomal protein L29
VRKAIDFREMSSDDLIHEYRRAKEELFRLRYRVASGQLDDSKAVWRVRKEVARIATVLRAREIEAAKAAKQAVSSDV